MTQYRTIDGDSADAICHRLLGRTAGAVEAMLDANPGLAALGPVLEAGLVLTLPPALSLAAPTPTRTVRLWD